MKLLHLVGWFIWIEWSVLVNGSYEGRFAFSSSYFCFSFFVSSSRIVWTGSRRVFRVPTVSWWVIKHCIWGMLIVSDFQSILLFPSPPSYNEEFLLFPSACSLCTFHYFQLKKWIESKWIRNKEMASLLLCYGTQRRLVFTDVSGQPIGPRIKWGW